MSNDNANFTPVLNGYTGQQPFRYWCQTVLPLVYDDSLSYYELLNKMVVYLNNVISDVSNMETNVQSLFNAYVQLQNYVNSYFDSLDVQANIDHKLDEMVLDGTFDEIINEQIFGEFNNRIQTAENGITTLANTKVGKSDTDYITMDMLTQQVKTAMTGGSVAVVGTGAVGSTNIQNGAVNYLKISNSAKPVMLNANPDNTITIDETNHTISLSSNFNFVAAGNTVSVTGSPTVSYSPTGTYWLTVSPDNLTTIQLESVRTIDNFIIGKVVNGVFAFISDVKVVYTNRLALNDKGTIADIRFSGDLTIDFTANKVLIPRNYNLILSVYGRYLVLNTTDSTAENYQEDLDFSGTGNFWCIAFDTTTSKLVVIRSDSNIAERYLPIGFLNKLNQQATCILNYKITGQTVIPFNDKGTIADIRFSGELTIDFTANKVLIPRNYNLILSVYGRYLVLNTTDSTGENYQEDLDFSGTGNFWCIAFDTTTSKLVVVRSDTNISERYLPIGFLNKLNQQASCILNYKITGQTSLDVNEVGNVGDIRLMNRIIFDFQSERVIMPRDANILLSVYGRYVVINTTDSTAQNYQQDLNFVGNFNCLAFDRVSKNLVIVNSSSNSTITNDIVPIAFFNALNNKVNSTYPYSIISKLNTLNASVFEIAVFGDSITAGAGSQHPYVEVVNSLSGYRLLNYGIGECGYAWNATTDSQHLVGQGTPERGVYQNVPAVTNIKDRVAAYLLQQNTADVIFLFAGSNDVGYNVDATTFTQAVTDTIESVINAGKAVGIIGILRRNFSTDTQLQRLIQFNQILKEKAEYYGLPFLNLLDNGMNPIYTANREKYFYDNAHPNDEGYVKLSYKFIDFIKANFCYKNET